MKRIKNILFGFLLIGLFLYEPITAKNVFWGTDPFKLSNYQAKQTTSLLSGRSQKQDIEIEQTLFGPQSASEEQKGPKLLDQLQLQGVWALGLNKKAYISGQMYQVGEYVEDLMIVSIQAKKVVLKDTNNISYDLFFAKLNYDSNKILEQVKE